LRNDSRVGPMVGRCHSRRVVTLLVAVSCVPLGTATAQNPDWPALVEQVSPGVATIHVYDPGGGLAGTGTGFFVDESGLLVTNHHVLAGGHSATVLLADRRSFPLRFIVADDPARDLVLARAELFGAEVPSLVLATARPALGQPVLVIGSPLGLEQTISDGLVAAVRRHESLGVLLQLTAPVSPGSSGSPVVTADGRVVGVVTLQFREGQNLNFAVAAEAVADLAPGEAVPLSQWSAGIARAAPRQMAGRAVRHPWTGRRVRVPDPSDPRQNLVGRFGVVGANAFTVIDPMDLTHTIPFAGTEVVELSQGHNNTLSWILGLGLGAAGAVWGVRIAAGREECNSEDFFYDQDECLGTKMLGAVLIGGGGFVAGALAGSVARREIWVRVPLSRVLSGR
jgi:S1-C subfamily serine protease